MIKAILFDFDGVICDTEPIYFEFKLDKMQRMGLHVSREWLMKFVGENFKTMILREYESDNKEAIIQEYFEEFDKLYIDYQKALYPKVFEFVAYCQNKGIKCYICSNANRIKMESAISQLNLNARFDHIYTSYQLGVSKPNPEFYTKILNDLNLTNEEVIVIEDSTKGIKAAKEANIFTVAKKEYYFNIDQSHADYHIDDFDEIFRLL